MSLINAYLKPQKKELSQTHQAAYLLTKVLLYLGYSSYCLIYITLPAVPLLFAKSSAEVNNYYFSALLFF